jgi:hypothetical protein
VVCGGWDCWECQAPGTPILCRVRTPGVVFATGSPADFDGLGVTFVVLPAVGHRIGSLEEPTVHPTGSDYCLIAWGGQAAIVGLAGLTLFPA